MCHVFLSDSRFYDLLFHIDQSIAEEVQTKGCRCGGVLHSARYPRKPRGLRTVLDANYGTRLSFCCAEDGCRRRCTPPSVRFLGRKVYLGVIIVLVTALHHGLTPKRRQTLIEVLDIAPQTLSRWRHWWREVFTASRCWQAVQGRLVPPIDRRALPSALLERVTGTDLSERVAQVLILIAPETTRSGSPRVIVNPQKL